MVRVTHVINGIQGGGAENMLYKLLARLRDSEIESDVISLTNVGVLGADIRSVASLETLGMAPALPDPRAAVRLLRLVRRKRPDLVQTWLYHSDLLAGLAARASGIPVVWNLRQSDFHLRKSKRHSILTARACAHLSYRVPTRIICCSDAAARVHADLGYDQSKMVVIPNGFDLAAFARDTSAAESVRVELGLPESARIAILAARWDPQKDHETFVAAAARVARLRSDVHFVLCGTGVAWENRELAGWIRATGLRSRFHLLGRRADVVRLNSAADIAVSSSEYGEGFSNSIGEAMACETPCVVADSGNSGEIVGTVGRLVPVADPEALALGMDALLSLGEHELRELGVAARARIAEHFDVAASARRYEELYLDLASRLQGSHSAPRRGSATRRFGL